MIALRELDERLGLSQWLADGTIDRRDPRLITHDLVELFRTRLYMMVLGHRNQDDCGRLRADPAYRLAVSKRRGLAPLDDDPSPFTPSSLASQPTQSRLIETISPEANPKTLSESLFEFARRSFDAAPGRKARSHVIDVESVPITVHGNRAVQPTTVTTRRAAITLS